MNALSLRKSLDELIGRRQVLVAVHRGIACGDIMENTADGFRAAWASGGDIAEMDVVRSSDGVYYCLHDGMEPRLVGECGHLDTLSSAEIDQLEYFNMSRTPAGRVERLEEVLAALRGRGLLNIDRSWRYWRGGFLDRLAASGMSGQLILKCPALDAGALDALEACGHPFLFMPIVGSAGQWRAIRERKLNFVGAELLFADEENELLTPEFQAEFHDAGLFLWGNAICLGRKQYNLSAFRDDRGAVLEDAASHWGWLIDHGFRVIQTDFPALLYSYLASRYPGSRTELCPAEVREAHWRRPERKESIACSGRITA